MNTRVSASVRKKGSGDAGQLYGEIGKGKGKLRGEYHHGDEPVEGGRGVLQQILPVSSNVQILREKMEGVGAMSWNVNQRMDVCRRWRLSSKRTKRRPAALQTVFIPLEKRKIFVGASPLMLSSQIT